ncbi:MAG: dicarboxylate/amino acid:cation symporter [Mangrovibacterium sp.]
MRILKLKLHWQILIALLLAVFLGYFLPETGNRVGWIGELFLRALKMVIIPLVFSSIISGISGLGGGKNLGRMGLKTISYYLLSSLLAIITGLSLVNLVHPGEGVKLGVAQDASGINQPVQSVPDMFINMIPENVAGAMASGNVLGVIVFALLFGFFIHQLAEPYRKNLTTFFDGFFAVMMKITLFIIRFTPLGIFGLVAREISRHAESMDKLAGSLLVYTFTVAAGLAVHAFVTLPLLVRWIGKARPFLHLKNMISPLLTAFSTASSSATLPLTMDAVENKSGVSNQVSSFTLPLGATINMDGTALYECMVVMFIAQVYGIELSTGEQFLVVVTALLTSIGAAGIPMASLVMITVILTTVGLPLEGIGLIMAVDRILDMFRTAVNVWSDSCGAVIIARSEGEETALKYMPACSGSH